MFSHFPTDHSMQLEYLRRLHSAAGRCQLTAVWGLWFDRDISTDEIKK